ncbi:hypothetical protein BIFGAL_04335 [Bifidobacterium gallicum DSM 20093 = LMG 11596]|uniref:Uncharacterized protein n=1 Tax=Bifidobacterium gallicum DSM 20093 = LMG 11596 TaxID=561180 RepID=D1NWS9_9BIFI|nr:hypothetical protein BIFGAL_04335 [Bifidobacterium gallicum DSM 20093 = LMG 11596]
MTEVLRRDGRLDPGWNDCGIASRGEGAAAEECASVWAAEPWAAQLVEELLPGALEGDRRALAGVKLGGAPAEALCVWPAEDVGTDGVRDGVPDAAPDEGAKLGGRASLASNESDPVDRALILVSSSTYGYRLDTV